MEKITVHISPVGFEYQRILRGLRAYPCSYIYLLQSEIKENEYNGNHKIKYEKDQEIVDLSRKFAKKVKKHYKDIADVEIRDCSFVRYTKAIKNITEILAEIFALENEKRVIDKIWINIGTASKLFATAAMIVASFMPQKFNLFYVSSGDYTVNLLFDKKQTRESIAKIYQDNGLTYGKDGYEIVEVPLIASVQLSDLANKIIIELLNSTEMQTKGDFVSNEVSYKDLLKGLGEKINKKLTKEQQTKAGRKTKMKYLHHINQLLERKLIETEIRKREKYFKLTEQGIILALIAKNLLSSK